MTTRNKFQLKPTSFKEIFKKHGIPLSHIAPILNFSYPYTLNLLNGIERMTPVVTAKLQSLVDELETEGKAQLQHLASMGNTRVP